MADGTEHARTRIIAGPTCTWLPPPILGALLFGRLLRGYQDPGRLVGLSLLLMGLVCALVGAAAGVWTVLLLVPLWVVAGLGNGGLNVCTDLVIAHRVPAEARGRAFATMGSAVQGAGMIGFLVAGPLVDRFEPRALVLAAGLAGPIAVLACVPPVRQAMRPAPPIDLVPREKVYTAR
jgi:MFS family permease